MNIKLLAHRGGMGRAPENTLASFKQALADGADGFECDVCLTQDKQPVLIHVDFNRDDIREATGCTTPLSQLNWKEVQQLKSQNSDEPVAHLDDALRFVRENQMPCFVEPKSDTPELLPIIVERIHHFEVVHLVSILTFYIRKQLLVEAKRLEPRLQTSAILINPMVNYLKAATEIDVNRIIFGWSKINHFGIYNFLTRSIPRQVNELSANGIVVEAGFIQTFRDVAWALKNGVEGLWVDDVPYIRKHVEQITNETGS
ncbi:MAG: glycerophosphodiester phosphodiesterase [Candidatus Poribacteria bacterium]|nr:glycerophosphodiester phosphodiesterase [Candidatus Poribacteria bacterium]